MKTVLFSKKVNNTEIGKGTTHESYILVTQDADVSKIFPDLDQKIQFYDQEKDKIVEIRLTAGRENRIVGLGPFYRDHDVTAGDEIILIKREYNDKVDYKINCNKRENTVVFQKFKNGFEMLTSKNSGLFTENAVSLVNGEKAPISLLPLGSQKKREDSPIETAIFSLQIGDKNLADDCNVRDMIEVAFRGNVATVTKSRLWKSIEISTKEEK